jgi:hypothetical protein
MAREIPISIVKKPDDWTLRASLGGDDEVGYYCVYRGRLQAVAFMLTIILNKVQQQLLKGEPPVLPEDGKHTSPPNPTENALRIVKAEFEYWKGCSDTKEDDGLSLSGMGAAANILSGLLMNMTPAEYEKRIKERSGPPSISQVQSNIGASASDIGGEVDPDAEHGGDHFDPISNEEA